MNVSDYSLTTEINTIKILNNLSGSGALQMLYYKPSTMHAGGLWRKES